jgi:hypothetical protein
MWTMDARALRAECFGFLASLMPVIETCIVAVIIISGSSTRFYASIFSTDHESH